MFIAALVLNAAAALPLAPTRRIEFDTDEGTWISLDIAPDGRTIIFDLLGDLYSVNAAGGEAHAVAQGPAFDTQATYSLDGSWIAFVSDRSGADNVWISRPDGTDARPVSASDDDTIFVSPAWSADGKSVFVSRYRADLNAYELWQFDVAGDSQGRLVIASEPAPGTPAAERRSSLGATASPDGRYLYYAARTGDLDFNRLPEWTINRREIASGKEEVLVTAPKSPRPDLSLGTALRPVLSPDGRELVYATRYDGRTGLRLFDIESRNDRWLAFPVQRDEAGATASQDLMPRYTYTRDGRALLLSYGGKLQRLDVATGVATVIPFHAHIALDIGPSLRRSIPQETGPVRARLIQAPVQSPDGKRLAFSALGHVYVMKLAAGAKPRRLTALDTREYQPSWSPDGRTIAYVSWTARQAGQIWTATADGAREPRQLTQQAAFYTSPVFTPDGKTILALRSSNDLRMHSYMEYGSQRAAELVTVPVDGGSARTLMRGRLGGKPQFVTGIDRIYINTSDGLHSVRFDGSDDRKELAVVGPGWYFVEGPGPVDDLKLSPDGHWALAQIAQQLHVLAMPAAAATVDLARPAASHRKITSVGADFFDWADDGRTITWAVGSTFYRRPLASVELHPANASPPVADAPRPGTGGVQAFHAEVSVPRDTPRGALVLRGGTAITMRGDEVIVDADVVVVDDHIVEIGKRGAVAVPKGAVIRDVGGRFLIPGLIDTHDHLADVRRGVLDLESWGARANLAYGVTTAFDPSPLSIDMLAYEDLVDSGEMIGSRIHSTGPAIFSFNTFTSYAEVRDVLSRYPDHYRTYNLKEYRAGNRRVRQWIAAACREFGIQPTTEGALSMKLDLTQILDGFAGNEHALTAVPLYDDVVGLVARSRVSYTATLQITNGGPEGQDYYLARTQLHGDEKLNRFAPHFVVDIKTLEREWRDPNQYLFPDIAAGAAKVLRAGGLLGVGSHGEMPGIGVHWEMQAYATGGMTPMEVLRAATMGSAETIGRQTEFGSLEAGKYADLLILEHNPLDDIANTLSIREVMKNGRLYDADTLDELWPRQRALPAPWYWDDYPPGVTRPRSR
ncbi:MAG TPA: amidohydrolase family protein [Steroidobacteraceae bacterium]|nr:amidohydrolase family protein [Steroidobacteraceae bacterium]